MKLVGPSYGALLKLSDLCRQKADGGSRSARHRLDEFLSWTRDTLGVSLPYEIRVAVALIAGTQDAAAEHAGF